MNRKSERTGKRANGLVVAGLSGGSGKSVASIGLIAALCERGEQVVPFKKGPDYIDAGWLTLAAGRPCYNLDPFLMSPDTLSSSFKLHSVDMDFAVIEGNRGLYDGVNIQGGYSTADLAVQLDQPVLLVINCSKTTRTVAALVLGCNLFDSRVRICGVVLNQIATPRHETIIRQSVETYTDIPVLGIIPRLREDVFPMRHLGVTPHQEHAAARTVITRMADIAEKNFDLDAISSMMSVVEIDANQGQKISSVREGSSSLKIGIIRDAAFQFYYQENLSALEEQGAELIILDALVDEALPLDLDGLYIGGGFPETSASELAGNRSFRASVKEAADRGLPIYAECGGLIFLGRSIQLGDNEYPMAGVFPVTFGISKKPQAHGYSIFEVDLENPFYSPVTEVKGHEFRYSTVLQWDGEPGTLTLKMTRGTGFMAGRDGLVYRNVLALYTHIIATGTPQWAKGIIEKAVDFKKSHQ